MFYPRWVLNCQNSLGLENAGEFLWVSFQELEGEKKRKYYISHCRIDPLKSLKIASQVYKS